MSRQHTFRNPLGFHCPPNGTDPHYATEHDLERFLAFGLLVCWEYLLAQGCEYLRAHETDVTALRRQFVATVRLAREALVTAELRRQGEHKSVIVYDGDSAGETVTLGTGVPGADEYAEEDDGELLTFGWEFESLHVDDNSLLFFLDWGEDSLDVWLHAPALEAAGAEKLLAAAATAAEIQPEV